MHTSDLTAVVGGLSIVVGVSMMSFAVGLVVLGLLLVLAAWMLS